MFENVRVVLVEPSHPGNVGAVARAMKNMGFERLYLVKPRRFPDEEATWRAASAGDVLDSAVVVNSLFEALSDCAFAVGASARERRIPWPILDARRASAEMVTRASQSEVALVFGREDRGLTNEELELCHLHVNIPTSDAYRSLNLAMAVQILCYELRMQVLFEDLPESSDSDWDAPFADVESLSRFYEHLEQTLIDIAFLDPAAPRQLMKRLRRLYNRIQIDEMELNILRGILTETQKVAHELGALKTRSTQGEAE